MRELPKSNCINQQSVLCAIVCITCYCTCAMLTSHMPCVTQSGHFGPLEPLAPLLMVPKPHSLAMLPFLTAANRDGQHELVGNYEKCDTRFTYCMAATVTAWVCKASIWIQHRIRHYTGPYTNTLIYSTVHWYTVHYSTQYCTLAGHCIHDFNKGLATIKIILQ